MRFSALCLVCALELCAASTFIARLANRSFYPLVNTSRPLDSSSAPSASSRSLGSAPVLLATSAATHGSTSRISWVPATSTPSTLLNRTAQAQRLVAPTPASSFATRANLTFITTSQPLITPAPSSGFVLTVTVDCANGTNRTECRWMPPANMTRIFRPMQTAINPDECTTMSDPSRPLTSFSVVYTSTVTFWGNRSAYTPPYEPMTLPNYCVSSRFADPFDWEDLMAPSIFSKVMMAPFDHQIGDYTMPQPRMGFTFVTTAKNPSVVFSEEPAPEYSPSWSTPGDKDGGVHKPAIPENENSRAAPANNGNHKPVDDAKHVDGPKPADNREPPGNSKPVDNTPKPVDNSKPVNNNPKPVDNNPKPVNNHPKPVDNPRPVDNNPRPVDNSRPVDNNPRPVGNTPRPVNNNPRPVGNNPRPVDNSKPAPYAGQMSGGGPGNANSINGGNNNVGLARFGSDLNGGLRAVPDTNRQGLSVPPQSSYAIAARASQVAINGQTFSDLRFGQTSVVNVGGDAFTIFPSSVVGQGSTLRKPAPNPTGVWISTPTTAVVGGLPVTVKGPKAIIGSSTMDIPETATSTVIQGQPVSIGPGSVVVGQESLAFEAVVPSRETHVMVKDAQLITASGRSVVVVHSTTFTYGLGIPATALFVGSDTVSIGPSGVSVHGRSLGGPTVGVGALDFEAIGGNAITEIGPNVAVIDHTTVTVGPGSHETTRVIAGDTYTLGPGGITASGWTLAYPFGEEVVTTFYPARTRKHVLAAETGAAMDLGVLDGAGQDGQDDGWGQADEKKGTSIKKGAAASLNASMCWKTFCIAMGVWGLFLV
ncbi:hypothetical protein CDD81_4201 [Ophiocordyceps australis]|uniref:Uncharacterized protein n=1 Tax=Ophiocordyceps australis TaxID=1399860 RepID=A0A2C5YAU5_9HYPO|nr:hypothetical protein CDD81_4201 [Ophiocordyceps australis]